MAAMSRMIGPDCGLLFATTGEKYTTLARRAARNLRQAMPGAAIDLFTDQPVVDDVFYVIHPLNRVWHRPRMEALLRSRFARTIYLDADVIVMADICDVFRVLQHFDLAMAQAQFRNAPVGGNAAGLPHAFPQLNAGVVGVRRSPATDDFLRKWEDVTLQTQALYDQAILREMLVDTPLRVAVLPPEYNFLRAVLIDGWDSTMGAIRALHFPVHQRPPGDPQTPFDIEKLVGRRRTRHLRQLIAADRALGGTGATVRSPVHRALRLLDPLYRLLHRLKLR